MGTDELPPGSRSRGARWVDQTTRMTEHIDQEGILQLSAPFALHHGGVLPSVRFAWRIVGPSSAPVVVALGGISGHRRVFDVAEPRRGWWHELAGPGRVLPIDRLRILSFDWLGGSGDSTGPRNGEKFPPISAHDQAELLRRLLDDLQIERVRAIVGASYGGMVALTFAARYGERVERLLVMSAADRTHPMATAWRSVQRRMVRFAIDCGRGAEGLQIARALAMSTYRSREEFGERFAADPDLTDGHYTFPVEEYLFARGADYARKYQPDGFLCLSESIDLHRIDAATVRVPVTAIAVIEDLLVPLADMRAMVARMPRAELHEISSHFGHDAFLKEAAVLRPFLQEL